MRLSAVDHRACGWRLQWTPEIRPLVTARWSGSAPAWRRAA